MPRFIMIDGGPRYEFTDVSSLLTSSDSFSFTSMDLGDAAADRLMVVGINMGTTGTNFTIDDVTIAGVAATHVVTEDESDTILKARAALYMASVPTGTSGDVDVNFAGSVSQCQVGLWALYGLGSSTAADTASDGDIDANTVSTTIDVPAGGVLLVAAQLFTGGVDSGQTLTGADVDASEGGTWRQWGSYQAGSPETGRAISFSGAGGANSARTIVAASWS